MSTILNILLHSFVILYYKSITLIFLMLLLFQICNKYNQILDYGKVLGTMFFVSNVVNCERFCMRSTDSGVIKASEICAHVKKKTGNDAKSEDIKAYIQITHTSIYWKQSWKLGLQFFTLTQQEVCFSYLRFIKYGLIIGERYFTICYLITNIRKSLVTIITTLSA